MNAKGREERMDIRDRLWWRDAPCASLNPGQDICHPTPLFNLLVLFPLEWEELRVWNIKIWTIVWDAMIASKPKLCLFSLCKTLENSLNFSKPSFSLTWVPCWEAMHAWTLLGTKQVLNKKELGWNCRLFSPYSLAQNCHLSYAKLYSISKKHFSKIFLQGLQSILSLMNEDYIKFINLML